jgi:hypothetical protein
MRLASALLLVLALPFFAGLAGSSAATRTSDLRTLDTKTILGHAYVLSVSTRLDGPTGRLPIFVLRPGLDCWASLCPHVGDSLKGLGRVVPTLNVDVQAVGQCGSVVVGTVSRQVARVIALTDQGDRSIHRRQAPRAWRRPVLMLGQLMPHDFVYAVEARDGTGRVLARTDVFVPHSCSPA